MIPKVIHFIWIKANKKFDDSFAFSMKTAVLNTNCKIVLHTDDKDIASISGVEIRYRSFPTVMNNILINYKEQLPVGERVSHIKDIIRLEILYEEGGIYSDCDVVWLRNPWEYWDKKIVIGYTNQHYKILCNAIIMSEPKQEALLQYKNWAISQYPSKKYWIPANPYKLWKDNKDVTMVKRHLFFPMRYNHKKPLTLEDCSKSICCHLAFSMGIKDISIFDIFKL
jgi:mannosyltransferase OCH1-like enzyme